MARAEIYIEDAEDGSDAAAIRFAFMDGFKADSSAHKMCNYIRQILDRMAADGTLTDVSEHKLEGDMKAADEQLASLSE